MLPTFQASRFLWLANHPPALAWWFSKSNCLLICVLTPREDRNRRELEVYDWWIWEARRTGKNGSYLAHLLEISHQPTLSTHSPPSLHWYLPGLARQGRPLWSLPTASVRFSWPLPFDWNQSVGRPGRRSRGRRKGKIGSPPPTIFSLLDAVVPAVLLPSTIVPVSWLFSMAPALTRILYDYSIACLFKSWDGNSFSCWSSLGTSVSPRGPLNAAL